MPGNEKDSDAESSTAPDDVVDTQEEAAASGPGAEDDSYEEIVPGCRGGRYVPWGGIHGRLCLEAGDPQDPGEAPPLEEVLDELLLPGLAIEEERAQMLALTAEASVVEVAEQLTECTAIALYEQPQTDIRPWSFCAITDGRLAQQVDMATVRKRFAIEDSPENMKLWLAEEQVLSTVAVHNFMRRKHMGHQVVQAAKADEAIRKQLPPRDGKELMPGTKQPMALSQEWQEFKASLQPPEPPKPKRGPSLLPGALSSGSSVLPAGGAVLRKENRLGGFSGSGTSSSSKPSSLPQLSFLDALQCRCGAGCVGNCPFA